MDKNKYYKGILLGFIACFFYALMDALAKYSLGILGVPYFIYYFGINITALIIIIPYLVYKIAFINVNLLKYKTKWIFVSAILSLPSFGFAFLALTKIPLDIFYAIIFTAPIVTSATGILLLKEPATKKKIISLIIGFIGVMFITNPFTIETYNISIIGILLTFAVVILDTTTSIFSRKLLKNDHPITIRLYYFLLASLVSGGIIVGPPYPENTYIISYYDITIIILSATSMLAATLCITKAYQSTPVSLVTNTYYTLIVWGTLFGYFIFKDVPNIHTITGCCIIILANIYLYKKDKEKPA